MAVDKRATRLGILALVGTLLFSLVGARLWFLQTVEAEALQEQVDTTKVRTRALLPERGRIFDADGRILADNQRSLAVTVDWELLRSDRDREEIFRRLSGWVDVPVEDMERRYERGITDTLLPMPVAEGLSEATAIAIKERVEDLPGVEIVETSTRTYPYAPLASHVVGYMGAITAETKDLYVSNGYTQSERVGQFGIELSMERELHGVSGYVKYEVDNASRIIREVERVPPVNGRDIQLTIDLDQQQYAEQALETQLRLRRQATAKNPLDRENDFKTRAFYELDPETNVKEYYPEEVPFKAPAGAVVVQNYETGHIIALGVISDLRQPMVRVRPQRWQVRRDLRRHRPRSTRVRRERPGHPRIGQDRPRPLDARQPGHPGALQPRLDVQAVPGVRRVVDRALDDHGPISGPGHLQDAIGR